MTQQINRVICLVMCFIVLGGALGTGLASAAFWNSKPQIVTTMYPLYEFTKQVVGDKADVILLVPAGAEPHDWEPAPSDMITVKRAGIFIYNGAGMEPWLDRVGESLLAGKKVVRAIDAVTVIPAQFDEEGAPAANGEVDPHIWLDPVNAQAVVNSIAAAVAEVDSSNASFYAANADAYNAQLGLLHAEYSSALANATYHEFVTSHAAFGYLANRYGLKQISIMGVTPDAEPTPERMANIVKYVRNNGIRYIFFETLVNPRLSEIIAQEAGAQTLVLNPIEGLTNEEIARGESYISVMRLNLENLKHVLAVPN